jgi:hypothetical protein
VTEQSCEKGFVHAMKQGEDVWLLAELYYGEASLWWILYHANLELFGDDPEQGEAGMQVFIPYVETREVRTKIPDFVLQYANDPSEEPLVTLCLERYNDPFLCFDLYEYNKWEQDSVPRAGGDIRYFARASAPYLRKATSWRGFFYRG